MMTKPSPVLVSWVAVNNDPYERQRGKSDDRLIDGKPIPGPTLTVLFDEESPYANKIHEVVLLHRKTVSSDDEKEFRAVKETATVLHERCPDLRLHLEPWPGDDPTDHLGIFDFLREKIPELRRRFAGRELIVHISPGTPSMQTIWVLMAETGFIERPFTLVKSYRKADRRGRPAVVSVELGIETFYKVYKAARPRQVASEDQGVVWDPAKFRTPRMRQLFAEARRFAHLKVPVMLLGERGTGKTTLAGWIRLHSPFHKEEQDARWPAVACGQYTPETMRAELFGYKKGAFTGATKDMDGLLAAADGDTLFLDEVGDVSRDLQRLLIKAIEEKEYLPLGDDRPRKSDFRLLTATNIDAVELRQRLDPDFLDRISLLKLQLPPLREVREELPWLWETAYAAATRRSGADRRRAKLGALHQRRIVAALKKHPLPGNLRDLFRVAYRLLAARSDPHAPLSPADAVSYALESLDERSGSATTSLSKNVAGAYAETRPLDDVIETTGSIQTKIVLHDLKAYLADELRRISKERGVAVQELCDVSERALRSWAKPLRKK
ncbi:MAG: sigma-54-dependent Fis family transcriptional regulator [Deltaproteobacteria bacterium]|nr:MAG: sigma-54-dependent Fis family transcriptional regulator [Deltaproteobacteria bacterium]